ncbi:MAG: ATP-binding protein [Oligoflexia bacterium]|nr:ATP-binding protein [Oligoflexia bacterium]
MNKVRYLKTPVSQDLQEKMVFIGGPRQVGKTTLARQIIKTRSSYFNWDNVEHRHSIIQNQLPTSESRLIFDEIHKFAGWRSFIKGFYDTYGHKMKIIVTGSAQLDHFKKGGDSLFGRYHYFRLHPFSLRELNKKPSSEDVKALLNLGGFPEPILKGSQRSYRRWSLERLNRVVYTDINSLENIREISSIEILMHSLNERVASPLSIESLRRDLQVSHNTVSKWLDILQALYVCYRISPFGSSKIRAIKKEQKLYLWDWAQVNDPGAGFENMVAGQLLKYCHFIEDTEGYKMDLQYIRDRDGREVDFVVIKDGKALFAVECKLSDQALSKAVKYFKERTNIPEFYQVHLGNKDFGSADVEGRVLPFWKFCQIKNMP